MIIPSRIIYKYDKVSVVVDSLGAEGRNEYQYARSMDNLSIF